MWDKHMAALARAYPSAVLTIVQDDGYPASVRCTVELDDEAAVVCITRPPALTAGARGKACLLFHRHNEHLEGLRQLALKGELETDAGGLVLRNVEFVTANGRSDTDEMPHAGRPLLMLQFLLLGRRKAREYLAKRGTPWPPIPFEQLAKAAEEQNDQ